MEWKNDGKKPLHLSEPIFSNIQVQLNIHVNSYVRALNYLVCWFVFSPLWTFYSRDLCVRNEHTFHFSGILSVVFGSAVQNKYIWILYSILTYSPYLYNTVRLTKRNVRRWNKHTDRYEVDEDNTIPKNSVTKKRT